MGISANTITHFPNVNVISSGDSIAEAIEPLSLNEAVLQGGNVTLSCNYKEFSGTVHNLQWYRQYPQSRPEFLLYILPSGTKSEPLPPRLSASSVKRVDLQISSAVVSDSALYYCALQPTVTGNTDTLYKNLPLQK
uniref:Ig-like domain-containing protein n=1 Tax=Electrophorus electricus TaxID=8005 RepID=A0AAY5EWN7_ELEEL